MTKDWTVYAQHILDFIEKIKRIQKRGDILQDDKRQAPSFSNTQTILQVLPAERNSPYDRLKSSLPLPT